MKTVDMGNNERVSIGVCEDEGGFTALTLTESKTFRTRKGAERWLERRGYRADGERLEVQS